MFPWCRNIPPISCTSKARRPNERRAASRQFAKASGSRLSNSSPLLARFFKSSVFKIIAASLRLLKSVSSKLIWSTSGCVTLILRSFGVPKTFLAIFPRPNMFAPLGCLIIWVIHLPVSKPKHMDCRESFQEKLGPQI